MRIGKLRLQACKWASENVPIGEYENASDEKFAELIIQECCSAIRLNDVFFGGKFQGAILKHFGVEE
jgi:hypothetical protein